MSRFEWDNAYSVCVDHLDQDHKHLFALLNKAHDSYALSISMDPDSYPSIVMELIDYLDHHFAAEEAYMDQIKYPDLAAHKLEHQRFARKVLDFRKKIHEKKEDYTQDMVELTDIIYNWLRHHILNVDQQYTNFVMLSYFK